MPSVASSRLSSAVSPRGKNSRKTTRSEKPSVGTEAKPQAEPVEALADQLLVARAKQREAVAHHDPVGQPAIDDAALAARVAHHLGHNG